MYHNAMNEKSFLKVDSQTKEIKMQKSLQRQQDLERKYEQLRKKNQQLEKVIVGIRNEYAQMKKKEEKEKQMGIVRSSVSGGFMI